MRWIRSMRDDEAAERLDRAIGDAAGPKLTDAAPGEELLDVARALHVASTAAPASPRAELIRAGLLGSAAQPSSLGRGVAVAAIAVALAVLGIGTMAAAPEVGEAVIAPIRTVVERLFGDEAPSPLPPTLEPDPDGEPDQSPSEAVLSPGPFSPEQVDEPKTPSPNPLPTSTPPTAPPRPGDGPPSPFPTPPLPTGLPPQADAPQS